jgi:hypothetical protein
MPLKSVHVFAGWEVEAATYLTDPFRVPPVTTTPAGEVTPWGGAHVNVAVNLTLTWVAVPVELSPRVTVPTEVEEVTMLQVITPVAGTLA